MGFSGFVLSPKLCSLENTKPCAKPSPLAMLLLKPLLKAREKPHKALALDGFALKRDLL